MRFLLECIKGPAGLLPRYDYVYAFIEAVRFHNWQCGEDMDEAVFLECPKSEYLSTNCIPVGSVEFCLDWYRRMGVYAIPPLNIPDFLDPLVKRRIFRGSFTAEGIRCFGKSRTAIKSDLNGWYTEYHGDEPMQFTGEVKDIRSEWRLFVCDGEILGLKCYAGQAFLPPDMEYCKSVVDAVDRNGGLRAYALDVMVLGNGDTDILELHDFFACGLYGFSDPVAIRKMAILTQRKLLGRL